MVTPDCISVVGGSEWKVPASSDSLPQGKLLPGQQRGAGGAAGTQQTEVRMWRSSRVSFLLSTDCSSQSERFVFQFCFQERQNCPRDPAPASSKSPLG